MTPDAIVTAARALVGTPFVHQGRLPGIALDCAGLVIAVARCFGLDPIDVPGYGRSPHRGLLEATVAGQDCLSEIRLDQATAGDILVMRFAREPQHLAIHAGDTLIHSYEAVGQACEHALTDIWRTRIVRAFRFRGLSA